MTNPTEKSKPANSSEVKKKELSLKKLQIAIDRYFTECDTATKEIYVKSSGTIERTSSPRPYTLEGLSLTTGISRENLLNYEWYESNPNSISLIF